jgi:aminoglycoside phosphotransferase (APT) family kinase protein
LVKLHDGEVDTDVDLVRRLLAEQFPEFSALPVSEFRSTGTVNAIYRLGDRLYVRLPRLLTWAAGLHRERDWLPRLGSHLSLRIPEPVAQGRPSSVFPFPWAIYRWLEGRPYADELVDDEPRAAQDLARFVLELRQVDPAGAPTTGRRPLRELDAETRRAIEASRGVIDSDRAAVVWRRALESPAWRGEPRWIHTDLLRPNLLVDDGRLVSVIDFGGVGVGDPAADVIAAWSVFGLAGRKAYRTALEVDDDTWNRARGYALHQAALIIPYYRTTNPGFVSLAQRTVQQILAPSP